MKVYGCDCAIMIKTSHYEFNVPYSEETIREAVSVLQEEASIEGDGNCKAIIKKSGVTGCVVTPLTIVTAPLLLYLTMGSAGLPVYVSETKSLYRYSLKLLPMHDSDYFDLIQCRGNERKYYEECCVQGFELRFEREQAIKLKLDICGEQAGISFHEIPLSFATQNSCKYTEQALNKKEKKQAERFSGDFVKYSINGKDYKNIYGLTILVKKENGTKTEVWIRRVLDKKNDLPNNINEIVITAKLLRDKYEHRHFGLFRITINNLVLVSDETSINTCDAVIGPLRYYVSGGFSTDVYISGESL